MKYLFLVLFVLIGCNKKPANYEGRTVSFDEHVFGKQVDLYRNDNIFKKFKYTKKEEIRKKEFVRKYVKSGRFSCNYSGFCMKGGKFKFSSYCYGRRNEKREYTETKIFPSIKYSSYNKSITLVLSPYISSDYIRLETGKCR